MFCKGVWFFSEYRKSLLELCKFLRYSIKLVERYIFGSTRISETWCVEECVKFLCVCDPFLLFTFPCYLQVFDFNIFSEFVHD